MTRIEDYMTVNEVALSKGVDVTTVYKAITAGTLSVEVHFGRKVLPRASVEAWQPSTHGGRRPGQGRPRKAKGE